MTVFVRPMVGALAAAAFLSFAVAASAAEKVRVALGDVVSVETLAFVIALERAKERGVDYELTSFAKEELAIQAIVNGQSDLGVGTPYSVIQKSKVPLKNLFQMSRLIFFPVATVELQDLEGSGWPADHLPRSRHGHRSHRQYHRQARRHHLRRPQLRAGFGKPHHRHDERADQGDGRRPRQQERADGQGGRQVPCAARRRESGER